MRAPARRLYGVVAARRPRLTALGTDLVVLGGVSGLLLLVAALLDRSGVLPVGEVLILLTVAAAIAAAVLLTFTARLGADPVATRLASALLVVGFVVFPLTVIEFADGSRDVGQLSRDLALIGGTGLFAWSAARRPVLGYVWPAAAVVTAPVLATAGLLGLFPRLQPTPAVLNVVEYGSRAAWVVVAVTLVITGATRGDSMLRRVGLGMGTIGLWVPIMFLSLPELLGPVLWFGGVAMMLLGVLALARDTIADLTRSHRESQARADAAESVAQSVRQRQHEMRNVVAGLSGAASVLEGTDLGLAEQERLRSAVRAELERLRQMLEPAAGSPGVAEEARLDEVLVDLVAMHGSSGVAVSVDVPAELCSAAPADVVAQAVQNLLQNCDRHAPDAAVTVRADRVGSRVLVEVIDDGPGLPTGSASTLLRRGVKRAGSPGDGLGLHITQELLTEHGGDVRLEPVGSGGCRAVLELPAGAAAGVRERMSA